MELKELLDISSMEYTIVNSTEIVTELPSTEMYEIHFPPTIDGKQGFIIYIPVKHTAEQGFLLIAATIWEYAMVSLSNDDNYVMSNNNPFAGAIIDKLDQDNFLDDVNNILGNEET